MGYPMTWRRVVNRNDLAQGGYGDGQRKVAVNITHPGVKDDPEHPGGLVEASWSERYETMGPTWHEELRRQKDRWGALLGDLRRLEADALDENAVCRAIAREVEVDPEIVAAVLGAFLRR